MDEKEREFYWYWFVNIRGIGNVTRKKLFDYFGHPKHIYHEKESAFTDILNERQKSYLVKSRNWKMVEQSKQRLKESRAQFIHWESKDYPELLRQIFDPPYGLYLIGGLPDFNKPILGMIGARNPSVYGKKAAGYFARSLAEYGVQIVSGLAAGIDSISHRGALIGGGFTLGILGGGIDTIYPKENFNLYMEMYERGGVLSEHNLGTPNHPGLFPARNRLISGISDGIFVLEASGEKSGTYITVDQALEQGKDVFSLPGRITDPMSAGCNRLIAQGAYPVQCPEDILRVLDEKKKRTFEVSQTILKETKGLHRKPIFQTEEQKTIYHLLDEVIPKNFDMLLRESGYNIQTLQHILFEMELLGWVYQPNQNSYLKKFF